MLELALAGVRFRQGNFRAAAILARSAISRARQLGFREGEAHGVYLLENALRLVGDPEASRYRGAAVAIYEELHDLIGQGKALNNLGVSAYYDGQLDDALSHWQRSATLLERAGDIVEASHVRNNIAEVLSDRGDFDMARELFERAHDVYVRTGFTMGIGFTLSNLGRLATRQADHATARRELELAIQIFERLGSNAFLVEAIHRLLECEQDAGNFDRACELVERLLGMDLSGNPDRSREKLESLRSEVSATAPR